MPALFLVSLALQIACAVHVIRSGRSLYWIWLLLIASYLGVAIYVLAAVIPDLQSNPGGRKAARKAMQTLDPARRRRALQRRLETSDTIDNRRHLAEECLELGDYTNAEELYRGLLKGLYAEDPDFMLGLARAQGGQDDFAAARDTLDALARTNPNYTSHEGDLLHARCLEALGDTAAALQAYSVLARSYPGEEGRYRYGHLLHRAERHAEARDVFAAQLKQARSMPAYYRRKERPWLRAARQELTQLGARG
ncbi:MULTISPECIES: tetratricopeptide repeat protein [Oleiagrimonas]|jgi:hypothetical protein|uniref:Tetratricopeptide repeat protein n=1 Tax=Oleiagrimonas citrea TaxID=1665687 RepID=A0A846ZM09_9GAMM|nr:MULTISPECIES: tetratricopeptide repeat protein [Oleiagrimonas]NKZ39264.1 tetratricopeptide repeat protein [Oleiagrimonas citrea]RAP57847.1 hypothetical protein BTJ49_08240 [Oleiagrimonas sp. MCCC 1A03011]